MNIVEMDVEQTEILSKLAGFEPVSLKEIESVQLMSRYDMKYVFKLSQLPGFLGSLQKSYRVLRIDELPLFRYQNLYFDTAELKSYHDHHNSRASRYKLRYRKYVDSDKCFFEVKKKTNTGLTKKSRLRVDAFSKNLTLLELDFTTEQLGIDALTLLPQIANSFSRITLVNLNAGERVTIDLLISFEHGSQEKSLNELVIAEVKQQHASSVSAWKKLMQSNRIFPTRISKYCLGTLLTHPGIKYNRFKPKLTVLKKICDVDY